MLVRSLIAWFTPPRFAIHLGGSPSVPPVPAPLPPPPVLQSPQGQQAADDAKRRAQAAYGLGATVMTGPQGLTAPATTQSKTLLGG